MPFREETERKKEREKDTKQEKLKRESEEQRWIGKTSTETITLGCHKRTHLEPPHTQYIYYLLHTPSLRRRRP